jgi:DNA-binding CsgD family transcriptional regulator
MSALSGENLWARWPGNSWTENELKSSLPAAGQAGMSASYETLDCVMNRRGASPILVGRAAEMAALETALEAVRHGEPAALLIGGEAGMGKTRLIGEFTAAARAVGAQVLTGACLELGADGLPYGPFTAMLRELVRDAGPGEIAGLLPSDGRAARELSRLLPELANGTPADSTGSTNALSAGEARAHLFEGFLTLLERLAGQGPVVLIIEDMHWADRSSRDLLAFLTGYQRTVGNLLIVVTYRSDELHRTHPLRPLLAELARIEWVDKTELAPLTRGEAEEFAAAVLGKAPDRSFADAVFDRAQGNPLFTEELLSSGGECDTVPDTLADLLLQAVRRLPEDTQEVLRIATAGSGVISPALLSKVTGLDAGQLAAAIRPAVAANVLVTSGGGYTFRHALIQEAVHLDLLPGEHAAVHGRFADAIDADPTLVPPGRADTEKARHWYSSHNTTGSLVASWQASIQASNAVAHAERLVLLDRVLELWAQVPDAAEQIGVDRIKVLSEAAEAARDSGDAQRGLAFVELALAALDEVTDPVPVALLLCQRFMFRKELGLARFESDLHRAIALVPEEVSPSARVELLLSSYCCGSETSESQFRAWGDEALRLARQLGDRDAESRALSTLAMIEANQAQGATGDSEVYRLLEQARQLARQGRTYHPTVSLMVRETHLLCGGGEYERAVTAARQGIADAERHGLARTSGALLSINLAEPLWYLGHWDEALTVTGGALDLAPSPHLRAWLWLVDGSITVARGDLARAARRVAATRSVLARSRYEEGHHLPLAVLDIQVALGTEGPAAAVEVATEAFNRYDVSAASPRYGWPLVVAAAMAAGLVPGSAREASEAAELLDRLRSVAEKLDAFGPVQDAWQRTYAALDPEAELDLGMETALDRLALADAAVAAWEAVGQPYETAVMLAYAAQVALADRASGAVERLQRAAQIAERLGAAPLSARIADLLPDTDRSRANGTGGATGNAGAPALTSRELEVLRLVAAGQSNREIAAALVISPKTASVHVSNILAKLAAATRTEAAVKAHDLGLLIR